MKMTDEMFGICQLGICTPICTAHQICWIEVTFGKTIVLLGSVSKGLVSCMPMSTLP